MRMRIMVNKRSAIIVLATIICMGLSGCISEGGTGASVQTTTAQIIPSDLDILYHNIIMNNEVNLNVIAEELSFDLKKSYDEGQFRMSDRGKKPDDSNVYTYYSIKHPNEQKPDMEVGFLYNETKNEYTFLAYVDLLSNVVQTKRGIAFGDSEAKLIAAYKDSIALNNENPSNPFYYTIFDANYLANGVITFYIEPVKRTIARIMYDYNSDGVPEALGYYN